MGVFNLIRTSNKLALLVLLLGLLCVLIISVLWCMNSIVTLAYNKSVERNLANGTYEEKTLEIESVSVDYGRKETAYVRATLGDKRYTGKITGETDLVYSKQGDKILALVQGQEIKRATLLGQ